MRSWVDALVGALVGALLGETVHFFEPFFEHTIRDRRGRWPAAALPRVNSG